MKNKKSILFLTALVIALTFTHPSFAVEIKGKVVGGEGSRVKIAYESDFAPREGDAVQIGDELGGIFTSWLKGERSRGNHKRDVQQSKWT